MQLPDLSQAIELADGRSLGSFYSFARECREVGLITRSAARGRAAAHMTIADAATLLIASSCPLPVRLLPAAVQAFRVMPRMGKPRAFRIGKSQRWLSMADYAGDFLELLIQHAPHLPDDIQVECRYSPRGLALICGVGRTAAVEYWATVKVGIEPPGGDRVIEHGASFGVKTLRLVHDAVAENPRTILDAPPAREQRSRPRDAAGTRAYEQGRQPAL